MGKILDLLFDTFVVQSIFMLIYIPSLLFLCRLFHLSKYHENFMVVYLGYDYAKVIFLDFSMH
jgi:hypothetical protein